MPFALFWLASPPLSLAETRPKSGVSDSHSQKLAPKGVAKNQKPRLAEQDVPQVPQNQPRSSSEAGLPVKTALATKGKNNNAKERVGTVNHKKKLESQNLSVNNPGPAGKKNQKKTISDKTGRVLRTISSLDLQHQVNAQFQPLLNLCGVRNKTPRQKTALFMAQLKKINTYAVDQEDYFIGEDRRLLLAIHAQLDGFLEYVGDWTKKVSRPNISEMQHHFEHTYRYRYKIPEGVPIESVAPWWVKQILAGMSCLSQPPVTHKDT